MSTRTGVEEFDLVILGGGTGGTLAAPCSDSYDSRERQRISRLVRGGRQRELA